MFYKNTSYTVKTFYGVTFKPNDIKEVPGFINNKYMVPVDKPDTIESTKSQQKPSSEKPKKESAKDEGKAAEPKPDESKKELEKAAESKS